MVRFKKYLIGICALFLTFTAGPPTRLEASQDLPPQHAAILDQIQALVAFAHQTWLQVSYDDKGLMEALDRILQTRLVDVEEDPAPERIPQSSTLSKEASPNDPPEAIDLSGLSNESQSWSWGYPDDTVAKYKGYYNKGGDRLFLTMDFGSDFGYTDPILNTLKAKGIKATFFLTTEYIHSHPQYVKRMAQDGHVLGNHSTGHINMVKLLNQSPDELNANTRAWEEAMDDLLGYHTNLYRAPEGVYSEAGLAYLNQMGYQTIFWGAAYKDYDPDDQPDDQSALEDIKSRTKAGDIVLLHPMKANAQILADYIDYWQGQGLTFETL